MIGSLTALYPVQSLLTKPPLLPRPVGNPYWTWMTSRHRLSVIRVSLRLRKITHHPAQIPLVILISAIVRMPYSTTTPEATTIFWGAWADLSKSGQRTASLHRYAASL